jgi:hypothetical protein
MKGDAPTLYRNSESTCCIQSTYLVPNRISTPATSLHGIISSASHPLEPSSTYKKREGGGFDAVKVVTAGSTFRFIPCKSHTEGAFVLAHGLLEWMGGRKRPISWKCDNEERCGEDEEAASEHGAMSQESYCGEFRV